MATHFGSYLVEVGAISPTDLVDALELQRRQRPLLGRVALSEKLLTVPQLMRILDEQARRPEPVGRIAVRLGLLDDVALARLLEIQRRRTPPIGAVLLEMGRISSTAIEEHTTAWRELHQQLANEAARAEL